VALPTLKELKDYLRVEQAAEDSSITDLLSSALSWAESEIKRPIIAEPRTFAALSALLYDSYASTFFLPIYPVAAAALVITDPFGDVVDPADYSLDSVSGRITAVNDFVFDDGPHVITATVGLSAHPNYATKYEPRVRALVMGIAAILYHQRNPKASSESESGTSVSYDTSRALPLHLEQLAESLRIRRIA
jgi:hypothetical protein